MTNIAVVNFNSGEISPELDARKDIEKYTGGCRRIDNMIPDLYGNATRRPGTEFIKGLSKDVEDVTQTLQHVAHAADLNPLVTVTTLDNATVWTADTTDVALSVDIDKQGYVIAWRYNTTAPFILYDPAGNDLGINFEFGADYGDTLVSSSYPDCKFSYDEVYIYCLTRAESGQEYLHKYTRTGSRIWKVEVDGSCRALAIDSDEYIYYVPWSALSAEPAVRFDPSDGSVDRTYTGASSRVTIDSCISEESGYAYFCAEQSLEVLHEYIVLGL